MVHVAPLFSFVCCSIMCLLPSMFSVVMLDYDFRIKTMFGSSLPLVVCRGDHVSYSLFVFPYV